MRIPLSKDLIIALINAKQYAKDTGNITYVYRVNDTFFMDKEYENGWVVKCYPGGRTISALGEANSA